MPNRLVADKRELRVLVRLKAQETFPYELGYHHSFQGFIYGMLKGTSFQFLHDKPKHKFFCFSNLIPPSRVIPRDSVKTLMISSPNDAFIETLQEKLAAHQGSPARLGDMIFKIMEVETSRPRLTSSTLQEITLTSGTPIVVRIPAYRLKEYGIQPKRDYQFVYWRSEYTPTSFIKQLEENLWKKYCEYFSAKEQPDLTLFERPKFRKQVAMPLRMRGRETTVIGALWEFRFGSTNETRRRILQFGLDAGFGEMNSLGFGFMNLKALRHDLADIENQARVR